LDKTVSFSFEWKGEKVNFDAYENSMTPGFMKHATTIVGYPKVVAETVKTWDVTVDDKGTPYPLTEDELEKLPVPFLTKVLDTIAESWTGDKKKQSASASG
jgi:hypothetical protein